MNPIETGYPLQELIAVKEGIKPVSRSGVSGENTKHLGTVCRRLGLELVLRDIDFGRSESDVSTVAFISLKRETALRAYGAEKKKDDRMLGRLLGYPDCCIDWFCRNFKQMSMDSDSSYVLSTASRTCSRPSFLNNYIYNFQSRLSGARIPQYLEKMDIVCPHEFAYLIAHIPCSFDCRESMKLGRETLSALERRCPDFAEAVSKSLRKPFLVFDDFNWISFEGKVKGKTIFYNSVCPSSPLCDSRFSDGNRIQVSDSEIMVYKDDELNHTIPKESKERGSIIDFS